MPHASRKVQVNENLQINKNDMQYAGTVNEKNIWVVSDENIADSDIDGKSFRICRYNQTPTLMINQFRLEIKAIALMDIIKELSFCQFKELKILLKRGDKMSKIAMEDINDPTLTHNQIIGFLTEGCGLQ
jgi:hypothetical protein